MASILENSLKSIAACYKGQSGDKHILDKSVMNDEFKWVMCITQVSLAIKRGELTQEQFIERITRPATATTLPDEREGLGTVNHTSPAVIMSAVAVIALIAGAVYYVN